VAASPGSDLPLSPCTARHPAQGWRAVAVCRARAAAEQPLGHQLADLVTSAPPRDRVEMAARAREQAAGRYR